MVHFVIQWDLPDQKANLTIYSNKARNDWLPTTLMHKGVIEIRNYRNPLEVTPHVAITIDFESQEKQAIISADPIKLRQIINNLVVNAVKFSPAGTIVTIRALRLNDRAIVEVEDQGVGIPPEKINWIFEPFATLGSSGTAGEVSTGLGLAIVKQLAEMHGASVEVSSRPSEGSLFRAAFPLLR